MGYVSITRLSLIIQEKISKLNAGNLSMEELDELKELTTELNERVIVLQYKAAEAHLLKQAGEIVQHKETREEQQVETPRVEPIKLSLSIPVTKEPAPMVKEPVMEKPVVQTEIPLADKPQPVVQPQQPVVAEPVAPIEQKPVVPVEQKTVAPPPAVPVNAPASKPSLLDRMQKTKIQDLKTAIGLNQKFLFMNFLFEGENNSYNDAIEKLNSMPTVADARHYIRELAYVYSWNFEDENVILFTEYVERRYL